MLGTPEACVLRGAFAAVAARLLPALPVAMEFDFDNYDEVIFLDPAERAR